MPQSKWKSISTALSCAGMFLFVSPLLLHWWLHGDYERYLQIINNPFPFSHFGGASVQLLLHAGLVVIGILCTVVSMIIRYNLLKQTK